MEGPRGPIRLRVERVLRRGNIVFARLLDHKNFRLTSTSTLGGCQVKHFDIPRAVKEDGSIDLEIFGFFLSDPSDLDRFHIGDVVSYVE